MSYKGQNEMFRQLIWGIVRLCRSNMTRDMIKNWKVDFSKNVNFHTFFFQIFASKFLSVFTIFQDYNFHPTSTISISYKSCTKGSSVLLNIAKLDHSDESDEVFLSKLWSMEHIIFILHQQSASHMKAVIFKLHLVP